MLFRALIFHVFRIYQFLLQSSLSITSHERHIVSNHRSFDFLFRRLCGPTLKNFQSPRYWSFLRNSPVTGEFPAQRVSNAEKLPSGDVTVYCRHYIIQTHHGCPSKMHSDFMPGASKLIKSSFTVVTYQISVYLPMTTSQYPEKIAWKLDIRDLIGRVLMCNCNCEIKLTKCSVCIVLSLTKTSTKHYTHSW